MAAIDAAVVLSLSILKELSIFRSTDLITNLLVVSTTFPFLVATQAFEAFISRSHSHSYPSQANSSYHVV